MTSEFTASELIDIRRTQRPPHLLSCGTIQRMFIDYVFNVSAFKHGIAETDIRTAFLRPLFDGLLEGYDNKYLLTGFDTHGNVLEIMYNLIDEQTVHIFHAMRCRKALRMLRNQD
ncbi:hypothetical protein FACS1894158_00900 [Betaproteobacteria bacterium]|nr:hypothetical protein FACS1894158_00900 [Betaproteobacteria bacterium]